MEQPPEKVRTYSLSGPTDGRRRPMGGLPWGHTRKKHCFAAPCHVISGRGSDRRGMRAGSSRIRRAADHLRNSGSNGAIPNANRTFRLVGGAVRSFARKTPNYSRHYNPESAIVESWTPQRSDSTTRQVVPACPAYPCHLYFGIDRGFLALRRAWAIGRPESC